MPKLFEGVRQNKKSALKHVGLALVFWLLQFAYQYFTGNVNGAILTSAAFAGATLIGLALLTGPMSRIFPKLNYVQHRRNLGVLGFTLGIVHVLAVLAGAGFNLPLIFSILDPFVNFVVFGAIAFIIYIPVYLTSTDWASGRLGFRAWKAIHRLVYFAWLATVAHFALINTFILMTPPGYLLLLVTGLVFAFELAAFVTWPRRGKNMFIGVIVIIIGVLLFYKADSVALDNIIKYGAAFVFVVALILILWKSLSRKGAPSAPPAPPVPAPEQIVQN